MEHIRAKRSKKDPIEILNNVQIASIEDFVHGQGFFWLMKKIILDQEQRIFELEIKVAKLRNEIEPD